MGGVWEYSLRDNRWVDHGDAGLENRGWTLWRRMYRDGASGRLLLLGPNKNKALAGWSWVPGRGRWHEFAVSGQLPESWRANLVGASMPMAYDARRGSFLLFDSSLDERVGVTQTLIFDPKSAAFRRVGGPQPSLRRDHDLVYDEASDRVVLFGGAGPEGPRNDTWIFDPVAETWSELRVRAAPPPRGLFAMAYDARHNATLVYGGYGGNVEPKPYRVWALRLNRGSAGL